MGCNNNTAHMTKYMTALSPIGRGATLLTWWDFMPLCVRFALLSDILITSYCLTTQLVTGPVSKSGGVTPHAAFDPQVGHTHSQNVMFSVLFAFVCSDELGMTNSPLILLMWLDAPGFAVPVRSDFKPGKNRQHEWLRKRQMRLVQHHLL